MDACSFGGFTPTEATIYMNGKPSVRTLAHSSHTFDATIYFGQDPNSSARRFRGLMDEVSLYDWALSQQEVRELRHSTKVLGDTNFKYYYQFNESSGEVFNRAGGGSHAVLQGNAGRSTSTAPVGGGESFTLNCSTGGVKSFTNTDLSLEFPTTGTYSNGDLVVSRLDLNPDQLPNNFTASPSYWVINNYGTNATFSSLENIIFENIGNVPNNAVASEYKMYKRNDNDEGITWGSSVDYADALTIGNTGSSTFSTANGISSFSQFIIMRESAVLPIQLLQFSVALNDKQEVYIDWATAAELDNDYFVIERSWDGMTFETLDFIESQGNANNIQLYKTIDRTPYKGTSFIV
ncbi:MAG: hypothetical protein ACJAYJ_003310 [Saprospiraceae bacterium]|jgi:hypothetical protein